MGGFLRLLVLAAAVAGAVIWLRRGDTRIQLKLGEDEPDEPREADRRRVRELTEAVEQLRGELAAAQDTWRAGEQTDERVDALWSERDRARELEARVAKLEDSRAAEETRAERQGAQLQQMSAALDALRDEVASAHAQWQASDADRNDRIDAVRRERERAHMLEQQLAQAGRAEPSSDGWSELEPPTSFAGLVAQVRDSMPAVVLPDAALAGLGEMDEVPAAAAWAAETWRGLGALAEYAAAVNPKHADPANTDNDVLPTDWDFLRWCLDGGHPRSWPVERIGIDRARRVFPIDRGVNWSGQVVARTHLLLGDPTDPSAPIMFVHDDLRGRTGRIHIVFLGPQRLAATVAGI